VPGLQARAGLLRALGRDVLTGGLTVVTGATGHLGNVLLRSLVAEGATGLRAVVAPGHSTASIADLDVEIVEADMRDYASLLDAFRGADTVFHLAGIVSIAAGGFERLRETNVGGTRNVLAACREAGVGRLVYTSSVHALVEPPHGTCLDETLLIDPARVRGAYAKTKAEATLLVFAAAEEGLDAVVVFPSGIAGPYDYRPSETGQLLLDCFSGRLKAYVDGAYDFVDVRDVAQGLITAATKGRRGHGYLLSGHEITVKELLGTVENITGARAPRWRLPFGFTRTVSFLIPAYYWVRRERPLFTTYSLDVITSNCLMSYEKAERELDYSPRPLRQTLEDALRWFRQAGML
jgi:dihydroflavonol-4-reductase